MSIASFWFVEQLSPSMNSIVWWKLSASTWTSNWVKVSTIISNQSAAVKPKCFIVASKFSSNCVFSSTSSSILECMRKRFFHHSPLTTRVVNFTNITTLYLWMSSGKFTHHSQEEGALGAVKKTHHSSKIYHSEWWVVRKMSFFVFAHTLYYSLIRVPPPH